MRAIDEKALKGWIEASLAAGSNILAAGYQGQILHYEQDGRDYLIKVPHGRGPLRWFHRHMLRHEYRAYLQLGDFAGSPACHGLIDGQYLVLEYVQGRTIRNKRPLDEDEFHDRLFDYIREMHARGVAHMDLKRKDNLLVKTDESPCILDFGAAVIKKKGLHPFNRYRFRLGRQFDYNAWIKHKYHDRMSEISMLDRQYYRPTWVESVAGFVKSLYLRLTGR